MLFRMPHISIRRFTQLSVLLTATLITLTLYRTYTHHDSDIFLHGPPIKGTTRSNAPHPIDKLVTDANAEFKRLQLLETNDFASTVKAYRERRARHPPPGFREWYEFAQKHNGVMIEQMFDQIYDDLNPFWGRDPKELRYQANSFDAVMHVRGGKTEQKVDGDKPRMNKWQEMISQISGFLPDMDVALNIMDETRMAADWETVQTYLADGVKSRRLVDHKEAVSEYSNHTVPEPQDNWKVDWTTEGPYWRHIKDACPPDSPARKAEMITDYTKPLPPFAENPVYMHHGYIKNWTAAKDPCLQPDMQLTHGTFVEPISLKATKQMMPMFAGWKLPMNNEILLPAPTYWGDFSAGSVYTTGNDHGPEWFKKTDSMVWRGLASGGRNKIDTWQHFHRHRFISMVNGTALTLMELKSPQKPPIVEYPPPDLYPLPAVREKALGEWFSSFSNCAFSDLVCFPQEGNPKCSYTDPYFSIGSFVRMTKQQESKYLPDIDGNSFSGRYLTFLRSTSVPIKATIYSEWHDSRLVPWYHFVPMDNSFMDIYGLLNYFLGYKDHQGHRDDVAEKIAMQGKEWAERVLRKEDMVIYVYRLLLEYARVTDDNREKLAYVDDLKT